MPDFTARISAGVSLQVWTDPATVSEPSRLNAHPAYPHRFYQGTVGAPITFTARCDIGGGVFIDGPLDTQLGGRLFTGFLIETPLPRPTIYSDPGISSVVYFTPLVVGHYVLELRRTNGGSVLLHVDVT